MTNSRICWTRSISITMWSWCAARTTSHRWDGRRFRPAYTSVLASQLPDWRRLRARPSAIRSRQPKRPTVSWVRSPRARPGRLYSLAHPTQDSTRHPAGGAALGPKTPPQTGIGATPGTSFGLGDLTDRPCTSPAIRTGLSEVRRELGRTRLSRRSR